MLTGVQWKAVTARMKALALRCHEAQFKSPDEIPRGYSSIAVGQYPSHLDFSLHDDPDERRALFKDALEANGSAFMGLWFLSGCVPLLQELCEALAGPTGGALGEAKGVACDGLDISDRAAAIDEVRALCLSQLETARALPKFYQGGSEEGTTRDSNACPQYTMGWYPLVGRYRLPAVIRDRWERVLRAWDTIFGTKRLQGMSNLTDGDIWAWCMAIDDTTPGIFEYFGEETLRGHDVYRPLLGSQLQEPARSLAPQEWLGDASIELLNWTPEEAPSNYLMAPWMGRDTLALLEEAPSLNPYDVFPIQTFYEPTKGPKGAFSCAVMSNILAAIPTQGQPPLDVLPDLEAAALFVRRTAQRALSGEISWRLYAYDYFTIRAAPVGYLLRAHRSIESLRERKQLTNYPTLLDHKTLTMCAAFVRRVTWGILSKHPDTILACDEGPGSFHGNEDYANLIYCFLSMMNVWAVDPVLFGEYFQPSDQAPAQQLVHRVAHFLLQPSPDVHDTPGTGPYKVFGLGPLSFHATKSSICFVLPPLLEAYALYLRAALTFDSGTGLE